MLKKCGCVKILLFLNMLCVVLLVHTRADGNCDNVECPEAPEDTTCYKTETDDCGCTTYELRDSVHTTNEVKETVETTDESLLNKSPEVTTEVEDKDCGDTETTITKTYYVCPGCGDECSGNNCVDIKMSLGDNAAGEQIGYLFLGSEKPIPELSTPRLLECQLNDGVYDYEIIRDEDGAIRQIMTPQMFMDVFVYNDFKYEIRSYTPFAAATNRFGLYVFPADMKPYKIWRIENPANSSNSLNRLIFSAIQDSHTSSWMYVWHDILQGWDLVSGDGLKTERRQKEWDETGQNCLETYTVFNEDGVVSYKELEVCSAYPWGIQMPDIITVDPAGADLSTYHTYYTNSLENGYMQVARKDHPDGSWDTFQYDQYVRITNWCESWLDVTNETYAHRQIRSYQPVDVRDPGNGWEELWLRDKPRTTIDLINNQLVKKTFLALYEENNKRYEIKEEAVDPDAQYGDDDNLTTITSWFLGSAADASYQRLAGTVFPDGREDIYAYAWGTYTPVTGSFGTFSPGAGSDLRVLILHTVTNDAGGVEGQSIREEKIYREGDLVQLTEALLTSTGFETVHWAVHVYDEEHHLLSSYESDGTIESATWSWCCGNDSQINKDGTTVYYTRDALGRVTVQTKEGFIGSGVPEQTAITDLYDYDASDRRIRIERQAGEFTQISSNQYDLAGRLIASTDIAGLTTVWQYSQGGRIVTETTPIGTTRITETYSDGKTKSITGTAGIAKTYRYGVMTNGCQYTIEYTGPLGTNSPVWQKTVKDMPGRIVEVVTPAYGGMERRVAYHYNQRGLLESQETVSGNQTNTVIYTYDEFGTRIRTTQDVNENGTTDYAGPDSISETEYAYEQISNEWYKITRQITYPFGDATPLTNAIAKIRLTGLGESVAEGILTAENIQVDVYGNTRIIRTYVDRDNKTVVTETQTPSSVNPQEQTVINGLLYTRTDTYGSTNTFSYDALGRQTVVERKNGTNRTIGSYTHYNTQGQIDWSENAAGNRTTYTYDAYGRQIAVTDALTNTLFTAYDTQGQVTNTWGATYPVAYEYDNYGRMIKMKTWRDTNGTSDITTWQYNEATGLLTNKLYADGNGTAYTYTPDGKLASRRWARGVTTEYSYDTLGQLTNINYSDGTSDISYTYNRSGQQVTITDILGTRTNVYNSYGQLVAETLPDGTTLDRTYDVLGRSGGVVLDSGYSLGYTYDDMGRFSMISSSVDSVTSVVNYSYLQNSTLLSGYIITNPASSIQHQVSRTYELHRDLITSVQNTFDTNLISRFDYINDAVGRRAERIDTSLLAVQTNIFGYNVRSELIDAAMSTNNYQYEYDPIGNRMEASFNAVTNFYPANDLNQYTNILEGGAPATPLYYDADGNLTNCNGWTFTWNGENRLITASNENVMIQNTYDYMGRRVSKSVYSATNNWVQDTEHSYTYDNWNLLSDTQVSDINTQVFKYVWGLDLSGSLQGAGGVGGLLAAIHPSSLILHPFYDANGNVTEYVDTNGTVVAHYQYDPYGNIINAEGAKNAEMTYHFSTKYLDRETSLYYYGYRYYNPEWGRWINRDPISEKGGVNLYRFIGNAPMNSYDYLGWHKKCCGPKLYDSATHCCCGDKKILSKTKKKTGIRRCCWYEHNHIGPVYAPDHCWIEYPGGAKGFWPGGVQDDSFYASKTNTATGWRSCTEFEASECDYDLEAIANCMSSAGSSLPYVIGVNDCRHWSSRAYNRCTKQGKRKGKGKCR